MKSGAMRWFIVVAALLVLPTTGYAQEAAITGLVTDSTGGVLPGVTVTAVHEATGNTFVAVTDERGAYRIPARIGGYRITAELAGFTTVTRSGVTLLVGQTVGLDMQMTVTGVAESITVTGEAPLINTTQSTLGSNIDSRQMTELPVQGGDWTSLALIAPGNRTTTMGGVPVQDRGDVREYQLNMDGQQVTSQLGPGGQPRFSRAAIGEFQFISNRFDATQGRSTGVQVNAVTRSGTNAFDGIVLRLFPQCRVGRRGPGARRQGAARGAAVDRRLRRADHSRSSPLLRELRVRPPAEVDDREHCISVVQHHAGREGEHAPLDGPPRLPDVDRATG